ncbi:hypothetical protein [Limnofasciculus baicalensis]|nr:hypothetical protein [Limnofasciculus baicalensis]
MLIFNSRQWSDRPFAGCLNQPTATDIPTSILDHIVQIAIA